MAVQLSLPALLDTLTASLASAHEATPKLAGLTGGPTPNGVSLLDVKNELLLSYLQNLVFLILLKIRRARRRGQKDKENADSDNDDDDKTLSDTVVEKLVELRLYLENGVRPLEEKLRFQLDKILRAADDADRNAEMTKQRADADAAASSSDSDSGSDEDEENPTTTSNPPSFAPNPAFKQAGVALNFRAPSKNMAGMAAAAAPDADRTGVYRAPKINPTTMPTTDNFREARRARAPLKSATMDEYIREELSAAPTAQPSVGTNVEKFGRAVKTAKQRDEEARRPDYEESNFVRLPQESKADRAKRNKAEGGARANKMQFGGEDWHDLGEGAARIDRLTTRKGGRAAGGSTKELLDRSRKRGRDVTDSARGSGHSEGVREMGEHFQKRLKIMEGGRRDRGKR